MAGILEKSLKRRKMTPHYLLGQWGVTTPWYLGQRGVVICWSPGCRGIATPGVPNTGRCHPGVPDTREL